MIKRQENYRRIRGRIMVIVLILGLPLMVAMSATLTQAQNQTSSQMGAMPYDLHYIDMMVMHHRQGAASSRLAERKGSTPGLRAFAKKTADAQEQELLALKKHRDHWYAGTPEMDHSQMMSSMPGMSAHGNMKMDMQGDMAKLQAATGKTFDTVFLDMMIPHHQMAIDMSKEAATKAEHAELKEMARLTVLKQQSEIGQMNTLKSSLGGKRKNTVSKKSPASAKAKSKPKASPHAGH